MHLLRFWIMCAFMVFLAQVSFACHCAMPMPLFGGSYDFFSEGDKFIIEYAASNENYRTRDAETTIGALDSLLYADWDSKKNISNSRFKRTGNIYLIGYYDREFAARLLNAAIKIAQAEDPSAAHISVRFYRKSHKRSRVNSVRRLKKGYAVYLTDSQRKHEAIKLSTYQFNITHIKGQINLASNKNNKY